jgi:hypothetical protein
MDHDDVIAYLKTLKEIDFIRVFYEVVEPRRIEYAVETDGRQVVERALVVAETIFLDAGEDSTGVQVIAKPPQDFHENRDSRTCQDGRCSRCQVLVTGYTKSGWCPICLNEVFMT